MNLPRTLLILAAALAMQAAQATLKVGAVAPDFHADASLGGKPFAFWLKEALAKGPVVLYFYPAAFTPGCTVEAHLFAEASEEFGKLGASVVGMSKDDVATLNKFSVSECRSKFPVAADPKLAVATQYEALLATHPGYSSRTSYVIAPDGTILSALDEMKPEPHIQNALTVLKAWRAMHKA
ncbi:MAG TPA: peroxiredoxin [Candidatus Binatia bacterium]|nr:peroxiredoxin [Candidatus Binatia bacterium]